jgi:hypothetical protein
MEFRMEQRPVIQEPLFLDVPWIVKPSKRTSLVLDCLLPLLPPACALLDIHSSKDIVSRPVEMDWRWLERLVMLGRILDVSQIAQGQRWTSLAQEGVPQLPLYVNVSQATLNKATIVSLCVGMGYCMEPRPVTMEDWEDVPLTVWAQELIIHVQEAIQLILLFVLAV